MHGTSSIAIAILVCCIMITWMLGRARVFGALTLAGFVLGSLATGSLFVLLG